MNIKKLVYSSGDIFLPEKIKKILVTDLIGTSTKTFYVSGWSIVRDYLRSIVTKRGPGQQRGKKQ